MVDTGFISSYFSIMLIPSIRSFIASWRIYDVPRKTRFAGFRDKRRVIPYSRSLIGFRAAELVRYCVIRTLWWRMMIEVFFCYVRLKKFFLIAISSKEIRALSFFDCIYISNEQLFKIEALVLKQ